MNEKSEEKFCESPKKLTKNWRITLNVLFITVVVFVIGYRIINHVELKTTSALFIGLPFLMGVLIVNLTRTQSVYGMTVKANIIILCLIAPIMGEGSICILMMAPIFLAMSLLVVFIFQGIRKKLLISAVVFLPFILGQIEKNSLTKEQKFSKVSSETIVNGDPQHWFNKISTPHYISKNVPIFLALGFPLPTNITNNHDQLLVEFDKGGDWKVSKLFGVNSIKFTVTKDTSKIGNWIKIKEGIVKIFKLDDQKVLIRQTTSYRSKVFPKWYFDPFQELALKQLHEFAISSWKGI